MMDSRCLISSQFPQCMSESTAQAGGWAGTATSSPLITFTDRQRAKRVNFSRSRAGGTGAIRGAPGSRQRSMG